MLLTIQSIKKAFSRESAEWSGSVAGRRRLCGSYDLE